MPSLSAYVNKVRSPDAQYRVAPFWFWNHYLDPEELRRQVREMHRRGVGGFVMHPRHGRITPYLSEEWMDCIAAAADEAKKHGMWAWLYDEDNWPSGPVNGMVTDSHPEYRMRHLRLVLSRSVRGGRTLSVSLPEEPLFAVLAAKETGSVLSLPSLRDLSSHVHGSKLSWKVPSGKWRIIVVTESVYRGTFYGYYLDLLNPDATAKFIELTHEAYRKHVGKEFGKTIRGIFTDEPSLNYANDPQHSVPFTHSLPAEFKRVSSRDLLSILPALFFDCGKETPRIRCQFYETVARLYVKGFFKPIYDFCDKHGIEFIGHFLLEGPLYNNIKNNIDFFRMTEFMHWGGVDSLTHVTIDNVGNLIGSKMASSSSHLLGKPRTMDEIFGLADGWDFTLRASKVIADWHTILGINYFIPHAFYYSIQGFRKWECIPDEFYHVPYWPYYKKFADHNARVTAALAGARHVADVAVFYPVKSMWAALSPGVNPEVEALDKEFSSVSLNLLKAHLDYDYITEELIQQAELCSGYMAVRRGKDALEGFSVLLLPHVTTISPKTVEKIRAFLRSGGGLVITGPLPNASPERGEDPAVAKAFARMEKEHRARVVRLPVAASPQELHRAISSLIVPDVEISSPDGSLPEDVAYTHYRSACDAYFILNVSEKASRRVKVSIFGKGELARLNTSTGKLEALHPASRDGRLELTMGLEPIESALILRTARFPTRIAPAAARPRNKKHTLTLDRQWKFKTAKPNILPLYEWQLRVGSAADVWAGSTVTYCTSFHVSQIPARAKLLIDGIVQEVIFGGSEVKRARVTLNSNLIVDRTGPRSRARGAAPLPRGEYLDPNVPEFDVAKLLKRGKNTIEMLTNGAVYEPAALTQAAYLIGDFLLGRRADGSCEVCAPADDIRTGSWADQGYPFYAGIGEYSQAVTVPKFERAFIRFGKVADMVDVTINGRHVETVAWEPFSVEVTSTLKSGRNVVTLRVANTMSNVFHRNLRPSGILADVKIDLY